VVYAAPKGCVIPCQQAIDGEQAGDLRRGWDELIDAGAARQPAQAAIEEPDQDQAQPKNGNRPADQGDEADDMIG
jgi:hypothetical protein